MERRAWSNASKLEEQAVSMAKLGPDEQSTYQATISRYLQLTLEVKEVRDPVGKHGPCAAGHLIAHDVLRVAGPGIVTLRSAATYEHSGL